jgi:protein-tyrosine-phosphatase
MRHRSLILALAAVVLLGVVALATVYSERTSALDPESKDASIVFVCRNGVAMSVWSALTFNRLAAERGLKVRALARAAAPTFTRVPLRMELALALDGYRVGDYTPRVISATDVGDSERVILIDDAPLPSAASVGGAVIERWEGFPAMRDQYFASRAALRARVEALVTQFR